NYSDYLPLSGISCRALYAVYEEDDEPDCFTLHDETCPNENITFWFYTHSILEGRQLWMHNLSDAGFLPRKPLKVLIHGFHGNRDKLPNNQLRLLLTSQNYHVISPDFRNLAVEPCYSQAVDNAKYVGRCLALLLTKLVDDRLMFEEDLHLIGFGLGAHIAGLTANFMPKQLPLQRITALNPAKPLFLGSDSADKLDPSDAKFVDVMHTDVLMLGLLNPVGHVDFYVNMGISQPNCGDISKISTHYCYHNRAVSYYAESIITPVGFFGYRCPSYHSFLEGNCQASNEVEQMGFYVRLGARGLYFLETNYFSPYAMGRNHMNLSHEIKNRTYIAEDFLDGFLDE
ncbi:hypothetical protein KR038_005169, partial [Drosophila bunnanda]